MIMSVRNEERFLEANLAWHHHVGVRRAYVYLDRCTDRSEAIARSFPWVEVHRRDRPSSSVYLAEYLEDRAREALTAARRDDVTWLLYLDADEFAFGDNGGDEDADGDLTALVRRADPDTDMIVLRPREAIPVRSDPALPFWDHVHFQDGAILERDLLDPSTGTVRRLEKLIGHKEGKSIVRVGADVEPRGSHRWRAAAGGPLRHQLLGFHYHFLVTSAAHFREKYGKFSGDPEVFHTGAPVPFPKQAFKLAVASMSPEDIERYYRDWVSMGTNELERQVESGTIVKDTRLKHVVECLSGGSLRA